MNNSKSITRRRIILFNNTKNLGKNLEIIVEKGTRKLGFIRQTRENAFNLLSKLLQNPPADKF